MACLVIVYPVRAVADPVLPYGGTAITRNVERKLTLADNADCFKIDPTLLTH